jgi:hypothetical protein
MLDVLLSNARCAPGRGTYYVTWLIAEPVPNAKLTDWAAQPTDRAHPSPHLRGRRFFTCMFSASPERSSTADLLEPIEDEDAERAPSRIAVG